MKILRKPEEWELGAIGMTPKELSMGLLFVMPKAGIWPVTMHGMDIPIDVYWLTKSGLVVDHASLFPGQDDYSPEAAASYVLEYTLEDIPRYHIGQFVDLPL